MLVQQGEQKRTAGGIRLVLSSRIVQIDNRVQREHGLDIGLGSD